MNTRYGLLLVLLLILTPVVLAGSQQRQLVDAAIEHAFIPTAEEFARSADLLVRNIQAECQGERLRSAFVDVVHQFSIIEYYRLGQINQKNRAERLFFWPDRKGTGQKQLRRLLADPARAELNAALLAKKSVALQGLPALERIIFSVDEIVSSADCAVARAIAENIRIIAHEVNDDWTAARGVAWQLQHDQEGSLYRTAEESIAAVLTVVESTLQSMTGKKISLLIAALENSGTIPKNAPFWRSNQALNNLRGNLTGVQRLLIDSSLAQSADAEEQIAFELNTGFTMLDAAGSAIADGDAPTARKRLAALQSILQGLSASVTDIIASNLGVVTGFNAEDGD
ncbi:MAG: imelysin family protein [Granulosicoccus sp.]